MARLGGGDVARGTSGRMARAGLLIGALIVAGCGSGGSGGGGSSPGPAGTSGFAMPSFSLPSGFGAAGNAYEPKGSPTGKIRIANFFAPNGQPGPALDFYDTSHPGDGDTPLIANLAYGQVSAYVSPRAPDPGGTYAQLYIFPAGSKAYKTAIDGMQSGGNVSPNGWVSGQQVTYVIGTDPQGFSGGPQATFQQIDELGSAGGHAAFMTPPGGDGLLATNTYGLPHADSDPGVDVRVDGSCPNVLVPGSASNAPYLTGDYGVQNFALPAGSHNVEAVVEPAPGQGFTQDQCATATAAASTSVTVSANAPVLVFFYGPSLKDMRSVTAPVG